VVYSLNDSLMHEHKNEKLIVIVLKLKLFLKNIPEYESVKNLRKKIS